jgi:very-short-patch-repair endonuclease
MIFIGMKKRIISKEELTNAIKISLTLGDVISNLQIPENGKSRDKIKFLSNEYGIDISNLNPNAKNALRIKYPIIEKKCIACKVSFFTKHGDPKETDFCSYSCSNSYRSKPKTEEEKKKISDGMNKYLKESGYVKTSKKVKEYVVQLNKFNCPVCKLEKLLRLHKNRLTCSRECLAKYPPYLDVLRQRALIRVKNGTHSGWKSRKGRSPSYPEKFFMEVLNNNNILYEHELPCNKYFIDFAIKDKMIALEIDGKQHEYEDRKKSDILKDTCLSENGWKVYRIKWKSINNESGKMYIKEQIGKFLEFFRCVA